ncbi:MAG: discoidin domain-containing protein [Bacteroidaceae bacterium]|nr:discoidin domain-containing protein [Bacteroidaceae bacterium]
MRNTHVWRFTLLTALFGLLGVGNVWAQLTSLELGKVYHFTNVGREGKALGATAPSSVGGVTVDNSNKSQLWYVEAKNDAGHYALRNLAFGTYLQGNGQSSAWTLASTTASDDSWIQLSTVGSNNVFKGHTYGDYGFAHIDNSSNIVGWTTGATSTQWNISKIEMSDTDIQNALSVFNNVATYQTHLDAIFTDKSCTTLKTSYNQSDVNALPETLQNMVRKVAGTTSWEEANKVSGKASWGADYAKKYRVQLYEPYNEPECAASALGLNAHTNLNNPTGIFANNGDILYVMVESEIKEGSSLYLSYYTGHGKLGGYKNGYELKQGLNVIPVYYDESNFCVNYVVHTFDTSKGKGNKAKARKLSEYAPIKIHIEGGYINGYYNKMGDALYPADKNANWEYIEARATQTDVTVLGKYMTLQFPLLDKNTVNDEGKQNKGLATYFNEEVKVEDCINEWDNVMLWERLLLGVLSEGTIQAEAKESPYSVTQTKKVFEYTGGDGDFESDYSDYYNVHGLSFGTSYNYMYGGWDHCGYNFNTMGGVIKDLPTSSGSHWGPAHEIGHQHQGLLNMRGLTEVTNNLFANVVLWYFGETTSRYNGSEGALSEVLKQFNAEDTDFFSNNIWSQTIMYYKLFLYYHVLGHNTKFYPRLFEMLRQDPMTIGYDQDGSKCLMHFYKKCCEAAGEDLTEFFRAHGFFEVMNNRLVGDYSNAVYNLTQTQIDAAIAEVKAKKYPENISVLFITDATGETIQSHKGDNLEKYGETTVCAEVGCYANFNTNTEANYTYSISGNTVTMEGSGGVGFAILNEKGELIGFSDKKTFEISNETAAAIASGKASVVTLNADNTPVAATNVMDTDNTEAKYELLGELLGSAKQLLDLSDETGRKVGYYRASSLTNLQEAYESAKAVYDAQTIAAYTSVYDVLYQEYANLINNDYARVNITEGYAYRLTNKAYPGRSMSVKTAEGNNKNEMIGLTTANEDAQLWYFEAGASPGTYYLKNKATGLYPGNVSTGAVLKADKSDKTTDNGAHAYRLQNMGNGVFALVGGTGLHCSASQSYNIVGWGTDADATQWYITAEVVDETLEARLKLEETIAKTEVLVNEMAEVKIKGRALDLTTCTITSNTPETGHETKYLVDGNPTTFFHTNWTGAAISENHNFIIDLGEGNSLEQFAFNYITLPTSAYNVDAPKAMVIEGSTDGTDYTSITSLSGLPTTKGTTYASTTLGTKGTAYRYLRFSVTDATGEKLGSYYYFGLAEFGLTNMQTELLSVKDAYSSSQTAILDACDGLYSANLVYNNETATQEELQAAASALNAYYETLLEAYNENAGLEAKKVELQALIDNTTTLIGECGSVVCNEETTPQLNTSAAPYKLSDNNGASQGSLDKLYDGKQGEAYSYTSSWGGTPTQASYLQVDLGTGKELEELIFTFTNRNEGNAPTPTEIVVSASADGNTFTPLATYTSEEANWPPAANNQNIAATKWTSPVIKATSACRYWRFTVTKSQRNSGGETNANGIYHFGISEFGIVIPASCKVTVNEGMGGVTKELLLATYDENQEAKSTLTYATTEAQLDKAIANLQAQYDALEAAKSVVDKSGLIQLIETATTRLGECGTVTPNGDVLDVTLNEQAGSVNKNMLRDLYSAIENAQGVIDNTKATQEEVDAEIAELTAQIEVVQTAKNSTAKADLKTAIDDAQTAIDACTSSITKDGDAYTVEWKSETAGDVDKATLIAAYEAFVQANAVYNGDASAVSEYQVAKEALNTLIATLNEYKEGYHKAQLKSMVDLLTALIEKCNTEGQGDLTAGMLEEMVQINETATAYLTQEFATHEVLVSTIQGAISDIETNYPTWSAAQQSTAKQDLLAKIEQLQNLIDECRATGTKTITTDVPCALQTTSPNAPFYLSTNATDSEGVIFNLVDGKMNTFFQTKSGVGEEHYLLVDAGDGNALKKFKFSYRTNKSFFPYTIVVYGSNDNTNFIPLATKFSKDDNVNPLPTSADQLWISSEIVSETAYRYLRFNVTELGLALNVDGDKEIDTSKGEQLSNKYRNSLASSNATPSQVVECCFAMSEFDLISRVDVEGVTEDQITPAEEAIAEANDLANNSANATELSEMKTTLQTSYDALNAAYLAASQRIQVTLTTTDAKRDELLSGIEFGQTIGTFSVPYATVIPEGVTAYYAEQDYEGGTVSLTPIEEGMALPAEQGVILMGEVGVNTVMFIPATDETEADLSANTFSHSATSSVVMESNDYILANGGQGIGFYKAKQGSTLKQGKAFFRLPAGAAPLSLVLKFGGNTTDIDIIGTDMNNVDEPIFDIYGRQVTQILKGRVYIKNGKKFIAK